MPGRPTPTGSAAVYEPAADSDTELELKAPFPIKLPIREITP